MWGEFTGIKSLLILAFRVFHKFWENVEKMVSVTLPAPTHDGELVEGFAKIKIIAGPAQLNDLSFSFTINLTQSKNENGCINK